jgi:hypothetical protein
MPSDKIRYPTPFLNIGYPFGDVIVILGWKIYTAQQYLFARCICQPENFPINGRLEPPKFSTDNRRLRQPIYAEHQNYQEESLYETLLRQSLVSVSTEWEYQDQSHESQIFKYHKRQLDQNLKNSLKELFPIHYTQCFYQCDFNEATCIPDQNDDQDKYDTSEYQQTNTIHQNISNNWENQLLKNTHQNHRLKQSISKIQLFKIQIFQNQLKSIFSKMMILSWEMV